MAAEAVRYNVLAMRLLTQALVLVLLLFARQSAAQESAETQSPHFHHVHLNVTDPQSAVDFYTSKFDSKKAKFLGMTDAVRAQKSWLLFTKVDAPKSEITSTIWHIGWGAEDMKAVYQKQLDTGTHFATPITDISDIGGGNAQGLFFYAYVDGPDHQLIELNTANHHRFGHIHLLSKDPVAAGEWYMKEFGLSRLNPRPPSREARFYRGYQIGPSISLMMDDVNVIIFPIEYARKEWPELWKNRSDLHTTRGHTTDHLGFSVGNLEQTLARLKNDGVRVTDPPRSVAEGKLKFAFIEGPDHIRIELVQEQAGNDD